MSSLEKSVLLGGQGPRADSVLFCHHPTCEGNCGPGAMCLSSCIWDSIEAGHSPF